jgi:glutamine amidotransferase
MIALIDYGLGNLRSVEKALQAVGADVHLTDDPEAVRRADRLILPGVGAFGDAAANLRRAGFEQPLLQAAAGNIPLLGICVGMQLFFDGSEEMGRHRGLGLLPGEVVRFPGDMVEPDGRPLKVPQIGWNRLEHDGRDPLLHDVPSGSYAYFVHSYYCSPSDPSCAIATTDYGFGYASIVRSGTLWGIQCHPEKSQHVGLQILRNFAGIVVAAAEKAVQP